MPEFTLDDGTEIDEFDSSTITVRSPSGRKTKMARRLAPARFRAAVEQRERERVRVQPPPSPGRSGEGNLEFMQGLMDPVGAAKSAGQAALRLARPLMQGQDQQIIDSLTTAQPQRAPVVPQEQAPQPPEKVVLHRPAAPAQPQPQRPQFATTTTSTATRQRTQLAPDQQKVLEGSRSRAAQSTEAIQESLRGEAVDTALRGEGRAELGEERERISEDFDKRRAAVEEVNKQRERDLFEQQQALQEDIADDEIDSGRLWRNKSTGKKIALALGAFFSGFVRRGRGQSPILQQIQDEIDRDIQQQRELFASKRVASNKLDNLYAQARRRGLDDLAAVEVARGAAMGRVESQLRSMSDRAQSEAQSAALARKADEFALRREENLQQSILSTATKVQTRTQRSRAPVLALGADGVGEFPGLTRTGERTAPLSKKELSDLGKASGTLPKLLSSLDTMIRIREEFGSERLNQEARGAYDTAKFSAKGALAIVGETGVLREADEKRMNKLMPDITTLTARQFVGQDPVLARLKATREQFIREADASLRGRFGYTFDVASGFNLKSARKGFQ